MAGNVYTGYRRRFKPGKACDYISHYLDELRPGDRVVVCCRVSGWEQRRTQKLRRQVSHLRNILAALAVEVVDEVKYVGSGYDPGWLSRAAAIAARHGAKLVAESVDRFIRSPQYAKDCQDALPRESDLDYLRYVTDGATLVTVVHPKATPGETRAHQTVRGQEMSGRRGGRPMRKSTRRSRLAPSAVEMKRQGKSLSEIAKALDVPRSTVQGWVYGFGGGAAAPGGPAGP